MKLCIVNIFIRRNRILQRKTAPREERRFSFFRQF